MPFGEYELSPSLIGLSLLRTPHPEAFQRLSVRASSECYLTFTLGMRRSLGFASATADSTPSSGSLPLRLTRLSRLTWPATATRRFIMQKARRHCKSSSDRLKANGFRDYFNPLVGVLFTFPSRYSFTIGLTGVFSLAGWSRPIQAGFLVPRPTQGSAGRGRRSRMGLSPAAAELSRSLRSAFPLPCRGPTTPTARRHAEGLGSSPFARHYLGNHCCFLLLGVLRCFSSPRSPPRTCKRG